MKQLNIAVSGEIFCLHMQTTYLDVLQRRDWCSLKFGSLVKVRKQNPQNVVLQNLKFAFVLNMRKSFRNSELTFCCKPT